MGVQLSSENEAFLARLLAKRDFPDRNAVLDKAIDLLRRRHEILDAVNAGVEQLNVGQVHRYASNELDRFLADVEERQRQRYARE